MEKEATNVALAIELFTDGGLNTFAITIQEAMKWDGKVQIAGFGTFEMRERADRTGRNPSNGEIIEIPVGKIPAFKPGKAFKDAVQ